MRTKFNHKSIAIYGLIDPLTREIRYVGKSIHPNIRFRQHINDKRHKNHHKQNWIRSLLKCDLKPELIILERVDRTCWKEAECWWIDYFLFIGARLTNTGKGGLDNSKRGVNHAMYGKKHSEETRRKMSESQRKRKPLSEESRRKLSESLKRRPPMSEEQRKLISENMKKSDKCRGMKFSDKHKRNLSKSLKAYWKKKARSKQ